FTGSTQRNDGGGKATFESEAGGSATVNRDGRDVSGVGQSASGDYYAGRNGDIFRRSDDSWQKYNDGSWDSAATNRDRSDLDRQRSARTNGSRSFDQFRGQRGSGSRGRSFGRRRR
ncbi:MAG: hypothetical protein AAFQ99_13025, partial [Pseudomonadota bacterium]